MADPVLVPLAADTWVKVATNVTSGNVWIVDTGPNKYLHTYRDTGNPAPTAITEGVILDPPGVPISAAAGIDVYVMAVSVAGKVRVDG